MYELDSGFLRSTESVIGAAVAVHRHVGPGFQEAAYEAALAIECRRRGIAFRRQIESNPTYHGEIIGQSRLDILVDERLIVELKAVDRLSPLHEAQLIAYLRMANLRLGLLINFNERTPTRVIRRLINTKAPFESLSNPLRPSAPSAPLRPFEPS